LIVAIRGESRDETVTEQALASLIKIR
jgi:hypothetical protein